MSYFLRFRGATHQFLNLTEGLSARFTRIRMWCPRSVMVWLLILTMPNRKNTYRSSLRTLGIVGRRAFGWDRPPSLASIATARRKLSPAMCRSMLHSVGARASKLMGPCCRYKGRRLIAFDGTRLITQSSPDTTAKLERYPRPDGSLTHNPQALMVMALDVDRRIPLDWVIAKKGTGEIAALNTLLDRLDVGPGDIAVLDRGYASKKLFAALVDRGVDVVIRMKTGQSGWKEVTEFVKGRKKTADIHVSFRKTQGGGVPLRARLVERNRKPGPAKKGARKERMVILTTLRDEDGFDRKEIVSMYQARWGIELLFRELKSFFDIEPFHGKTVDSCEQEIAAALIWMALASYLQRLAESGLQDGRRVYRSDCLRYAADTVQGLLNGHDIENRVQRDIEALRRWSSYKPRPGRSAPRECKMPFGRSIQRGRVK